MKTLRSPLSTALLASVAFCSAASAQITPNWYLIDSQTGDNHWNSVTSTASYKHWADTATLPGYTGYESRYATAMDANAVYYVAAGKQLRTPGTNTGASAHDTFAGGTLILAGADFLQRSTGTRVASVGNLITRDGTTMRSGQSTVQNLSITNLTVDGGTTSFTSSVGRGFNLTISNLTGDGNIVFTAGGTYRLNIGNTAGFSGNISLTAGPSNEITKLEFLADLSFGGALTINSGNTVNLTHSVTVSSLSVAGSTLANGTYSYSWLNENYGSIFTAGSTTNGMITVIPEPSAFAALAGLGALGLVASRRRR